MNDFLYNAHLRVNRQVSSIESSILLLESKTLVEEPRIAPDNLSKDIKFSLPPKGFELQSTQSLVRFMDEVNVDSIDQASLTLHSNGFMSGIQGKKNNSHMEKSFYCEKPSVRMHGNDGIKKDIESCIPGHLDNVSASKDQESMELQSSVLLSSQPNRNFDFQLVSKSMGKKDAFPTENIMLPFSKQSAFRRYPSTSTFAQEERCGSALVVPYIKNPVEQLKPENVAPSAEYSPEASPSETVRNEGKLNSTSNGTALSSSGDSLETLHGHILGPQALPRSEDLEEVTFESDEFKTHEQSYNLDEADILYSETQYQYSEDMDSIFTNEVGGGTNETTREFVKCDAVEESHLYKSLQRKKGDKHLHLSNHDATHSSGNEHHPNTYQPNNKELKLHFLNQMQQLPISLNSQQKESKVSCGKDKMDSDPNALPHLESTVPSKKPSFQDHESSSCGPFLPPDSEPLYIKQKPSASECEQKLQGKTLRFLPSAAQPPLVTCNHCRCVLKVPPHLPIKNRFTQKLRCGACSRISVFAVQQGGHISNDDTCAPKFRNQMQTSTSRPKSRRSINVVKIDRFRYQIYSSTGSHESLTHSSRSGDIVQTSVESGQISQKSQSSPRRLLSAAGSGDILSGRTQNPDFMICQETIAPTTSSELDFTESHRISLEQSRTDSDCDSSKSAEDVSCASGSPLAISALPELSANVSPLHMLGNPSSKDQAEGGHRVIRSVMNLMRRKKGDVLKDNPRQVERIPFKVIVNGTVIPYSLVKKAEELAGPVHPGSYWYDFRAGFWGVTGGPCLGIIAPFIEEFDYPLSRGCSGGKTHVLVNGRELHHIDLVKLARRGLPSTPGKAYKVEIDGRVVDEVTGEELKGLGRLAPSIELRGHGYGMFVPTKSTQ